MAKIVEDVERVTVRLNTAEMNDLIVQPSKDAGWIDFDPTRVSIKQEPSGFMLTFERVEGQGPT